MTFNERRCWQTPLLTFLFPFLFGCQSTDPYSYMYTDMPDAALAAHRIDPGPAPATFIVRAEPQTANGAKTFTFDGEDVVRIPEGKQLTMQVPSGYHVIGAHCDPQDRRQEIPFQVEKGKTYFFRIYDTADTICLFAPMGR